MAQANGHSTHEGFAPLEPEPIDVPWPKPLGPAAYHGITGEVVRRIEPETESDNAALLFTFLTCIGNAMGNGCYVRVEGDRHPPRLFVDTVGESGVGRKGTAMGRITELMRSVSLEWVTNCMPSGLSSGEGVIYIVRDARYERKKGIDELVDAGVQDKRKLFVETEYAKALRNMQRTGNILSAVLRQCWDHGNLQTVVKNDPNKATDAHISMVNHITFKELRTELDETEKSNGTANRHLYVCVRRSKELPFGGAEMDWRDIATRLQAALMCKPAGEMGRTEAAWALWQMVYHDLSTRPRGMLGAMTNRAEAQVVRLALIYAMLDQATIIDLVHLEAALECWRYCEDSAMYIFGQDIGDPIADEIMRALGATPLMTRSDIHDLFGRNKRSDELTRALTMLEREKLVLREIIKTGGRPAEVWSLA